VATLNARSVVLSTLLGTDPPCLPVSRLLRATDLFGLSQGTVRTALTRMMQRGELTTDGAGSYQLAGHLLARQVRQQRSRTGDRLDWPGHWLVAVVTAESRTAADRQALRGAMGALRLAEQREGAWLRPDNLAHDDQFDARALIDEQCFRYRAHPESDDAELAAALWDLDGWASRADELRRAMAGLVGRLEAADTSALADGFVVSAEVLRLLQADPLLPDELVDRRWPGRRLRADYEHYDTTYRRLLRRWFLSEDVDDDER
jgi:phenylacetic acid degradation operon negative regulatory protein